MRQSEKLWSGRVIVVPDIVMDHLEIPEQLAGASIKRQQAVTEEVGAATVSAVKVVLGTCRGHVDNSALHIHGDLAPTISTSHALPSVFRPGVVSELTRMRNCVKCPH